MPEWLSVIMHVSLKGLRMIMSEQQRMQNVTKALAELVFKDKQLSRLPFNHLFLLIISKNMLKSDQN